jgi:hypothetical protein
MRGRGRDEGKRLKEKRQRAEGGRSFWLLVFGC